MVNLNKYEQNILAGDYGKLKKLCLENIVRYAEILNAQGLCEVTKATVFCGAHNYLQVLETDDANEVFSRINLASSETVPFTETDAHCYIQSCVAPCDQYVHQPFGQDKDVFDRNTSYLEMAREAGVTITGTCSPYLTGWLPVKGEHFVTTESGMTVIGNSLWGAMGNADGIEAAFWSAICGRTPKWGKHLPENRHGTHEARVDAAVSNLIEWDLLGSTLGQQMPSGAIPVVHGEFSGAIFEKLRQFCTSLAITSNCEMCHIVGYTPEARSVDDALMGKQPIERYVITDEMIRDTYAAICAARDGAIDFVSLGCPHYDIDQIKRASNYLAGKKISDNVHLMIWTVYPIKKMADENGYTATIEAAGGHIYTSSCPGSIGNVFLERYNGFVFDSLKQAESVKSMVKSRVYYSDQESCIDAAVAGLWKEEFRWN